MSTSPPNNKDAEEAVIGSVLINPDIFIELTQFLMADDFYIHRNRWIWTAFVRLQEHRTPIDFLTVCSELTAMKMLSDIGGESYLTGLIGQTPNSFNALAYGRAVETESIRRKLLSAASGIATEAYDTTRNIEEVIANCASKLTIATSFSRIKRKSVSQLIEEHRADITKNSETEKASIGILFNLIDLDKLLGFGLQKRFMLLAGRPGVGKTSLAIQGALEAIKQGKTAAIFSLEMDASQITNVIMSMLTGIDSQRLFVGRLTPAEWEAYNNAEETMKSIGHRLIIDSNPIATIQTIRAKCLSIKATGPLDLIIIDYLMKIKGYSKLEENDRANQLTLDAASLRAELDSALIMVHHMNRAIEHRADGEPQLSDLNEGGERDPDIVAFLYRAKDVTQVGALTPIRLTLVKHRHGPTWPPVELLFNGSCTTFMSAIVSTPFKKGV